MKNYGNIHFWATALLLIGVFLGAARNLSPRWNDWRQSGVGSLTARWNGWHLIGTGSKSELNRSSITDDEKLLLIAALLEGMSPDSPVDRANTSRLVWRAVLISGRASGDEMDAWVRHEDPEPEAILDLYHTLVHMVQVRYQNPRLALFDGRGNWGDPSDPDSSAAHSNYNSVRLSRLGAQIAFELLPDHPEYRRHQLSNSPR